jgi:hypothetical protein
LAHEQTSGELDMRYRASVVDALVSGHFLDAHDARRKARSLGLPDGAPLRVAMLRPLPPDLVWAQRIARPGATCGISEPVDSQHCCLGACTVAYRITRIETITGIDLSDPDNRLIAHVAVKIIESSRKPATRI